MVEGKAFELAIKMSLVTFKGQALMQQSGLKAECLLVLQRKPVGRKRMSCFLKLG